ncbi:acetyl-CoA hydrolase/transferase family protein [Nocardioides hwasunensis]|uniref:Acetyl-CoA hydrolase/transferase family protein n=1 Tax=Nocardioides hwasunensis TaxID=397258 RepID=A0ABR8MJ62_9ACTN|nr:acetyl-CoA hydrolase/transferase family protein [Nocardioides hwasunensis]MBD3915625.1 acetyl-CoA hydrolase/transferase family protein [Nocardioides hwasunensis]
MTSSATHPPTVSPAAAIRLLPHGTNVVAAPGCGTPETLLRALGRDADVLGHPTVFSGLQLGAYPFLEAAAQGQLSYRTWHPFGPARAALRPGQVDYVPARASAVPGLLDLWGTDAALVRVSPPDPEGWCSLGPSASYVCHALARARVVLAEVDVRVPVTHGDTRVHVSQLSALVEAEEPACSFPAAARDETSDRVAAHVVGLLPDAPVLQLGLGAVPEALTSFLADAGATDVRFVGMGNDAMVDLAEQGVLAEGPAAVSAAELMGTDRLMRFADDDPRVEVRDSRHAHDPRVLASLPGLVSVNSAIEVDLWGQVGSELVGTRQVSGIGGSVDFVEAGFGSPGGLSVVALASTTPDGTRSRIVPQLGSPVVTLGRHTPDAVVTEHGVAWLRGRTVHERAEALAAVAHPDHRDALALPARS